MGVFIARTLSWAGADFETVTVPLSRTDEAMYNKCAEWWTVVKAELDAASALLNKNIPKSLMRNYWSAIQRFFKELAVTFKVKYIVESASKDVENGHSVVIGLQVSHSSVPSFTLRFSFQ